MATFIAQFIGTLFGSAIKALGKDGVEAFVRGISDAMVEKQVVSKPNADLDSEWDSGLLNDHGNSGANRK